MRILIVNPNTKLSTTDEGRADEVYCLPIVDGWATAAAFANSPVGLGRMTCKRRAYQTPRPTPCSGAPRRGGGS